MQNDRQTLGEIFIFHYMYSSIYSVLDLRISSLSS